MISNIDKVKAGLAALGEEIREAKEERKLAKNQLENATSSQDLLKFRTLLESATANLTNLQNEKVKLLEQENILTSHSSSDGETQLFSPLADESPDGPKRAGCLKMLRSISSQQKILVV
jgi:hypothetical protein